MNLEVQYSVIGKKQIANPAELSYLYLFIRFPKFIFNKMTGGIIKKFLAVLLFFVVSCDRSSNDDSQLSNLADFPTPIGTEGVGFYNGDLHVFGGSVNYDGDSNYSSIYKLSGSVWVQIDTMMNDHTWDGKLLIQNSDAYYVSGWSGVNSSLQKYNFVNKSWTALDTGNISQNWGTTAQLVNNKIYHFGTNGEVDIYDIGLNKWTLGNTNTLIQGNERGLTSVIYNGNIYVTGYGDSSLYKYDTAGDAFSIESAMPRPVCGSAMAQINAKIYFVSGSSDGNAYNVYSDSYVYDLTDKSWTPGTIIPKMPVMSPGTAVSDNKLFIIGGWDLNQNGTTNAYSWTLN